MWSLALCALLMATLHGGASSDDGAPAVKNITVVGKKGRYLKIDFQVLLKESVPIAGAYDVIIASSPEKGDLFTSTGHFVEVSQRHPGISDPHNTFRYKQDPNLGTHRYGTGAPYDTFKFYVTRHNAMAKVLQGTVLINIVNTPPTAHNGTFYCLPGLPCKVSMGVEDEDEKADIEVSNPQQADHLGEVHGVWKGQPCCGATLDVDASTVDLHGANATWIPFNAVDDSNETSAVAYVNVKRIESAPTPNVFNTVILCQSSPCPFTLFATTFLDFPITFGVTGTQTGELRVGTRVDRTSATSQVHAEYFSDNETVAIPYSAGASYNVTIRGDVTSAAAQVHVLWKKLPVPSCGDATLAIDDTLVFNTTIVSARGFMMESIASKIVFVVTDAADTNLYSLVLGRPVVAGDRVRETHLQLRGNQTKVKISMFVGVTEACTFGVDSSAPKIEVTHRPYTPRGERVASWVSSYVEVRLPLYPARFHPRIGGTMFLAHRNGYTAVPYKVLSDDVVITSDDVLLLYPDRGVDRERLRFTLNGTDDHLLDVRRVNDPPTLVTAFPNCQTGAGASDTRNTSRISVTSLGGNATIWLRAMDIDDRNLTIALALPPKAGEILPFTSVVAPGCVKVLYRNTQAQSVDTVQFIAFDSADGRSHHVTVDVFINTNSVHGNSLGGDVGVKWIAGLVLMAVVAVLVGIVVRKWRRSTQRTTWQNLENPEEMKDINEPHGGAEIGETEEGSENENGL